MKIARFRRTEGDALGQVRAYIAGTGKSFVQAVFEHSFFLDPAAVRRKAIWFPDTARYSKEHFKDAQRSGDVVTRSGRQIRVQEANHLAQRAWAGYAGCAIARKSGYGVRHIWGHPWDPTAFTAGWNLCYMPFWAGMATEDQHPDEDVQRAIAQASFELFFRESPVCVPPEFVRDPQYDLSAALGDVPIRIATSTVDEKGLCA